MSRNGHSLLISIVHPVDPDLVVGWDEFLTKLDTYVCPEAPSVSFVVNFVGAREGVRHVRIDAFIRRVLRSLGITRPQCLPGLFTTRNVRWM
ncbi:MAG: hypothetical protein WA208_18675 [Thermoanaerobaculia bacterium]